MEYNYHHFPNIGYLSKKFDEVDLYPIKMEVDEIMNNFDQYESFTPSLAGHIQKEFQLTKSCSHIEQLVLPFVDLFDETFSYLRFLNVLDKSLPWGLSRAWVNFQKKHEFNPVHNHTGVFSFVIYLKIPFTKEEESKVFPPMSNGYKRNNSNFFFEYTNSLGQIMMEDLPVYEDYENTMIFFPACMRHGVYPFYTSDDYRISVAGNIELKTGR